MHKRVFPAKHSGHQTAFGSMRQFVQEHGEHTERCTLLQGRDRPPVPIARRLPVRKVSCELTATLRVVALSCECHNSAFVPHGLYPLQCSRAPATHTVTLLCFNRGHFFHVLHLQRARAHACSKVGCNEDVRGTC